MKRVLVSSLVSVLVLSACGPSPANEKEAFIDATVEATCMIFQAENILDPSLEFAAKEIYSKYGFDAEDDEAMIALTKKYEADNEVQDAILKAVSDCGGDKFGLKDGNDEVVEGDSTALDSEVSEDSEAVDAGEVSDNADAEDVDEVSGDGEEDVATEEVEGEKSVSDEGAAEPSE